MDVTTVATKSTTSGNTLLIPINFVSNTIAGSRVKIKTPDGQISEREIVLGALDANSVEVRSGIKIGETICN